ncbi:hypothetical protein LXL04_006371 [Taraxacum kok-saghyz]
MEYHEINLEGSSSDADQVLAEDIFCYFVMILYNNFALIHLNICETVKLAEVEVEGLELAWNADVNSIDRWLVASIELEPWRLGAISDGKSEIAMADGNLVSLISVMSKSAIGGVELLPAGNGGLCANFSSLEQHRIASTMLCISIFFTGVDETRITSQNETSPNSFPFVIQ